MTDLTLNANKCALAGIRERRAELSGKNHLARKPLAPSPVLPGPCGRHVAAVRTRCGPGGIRE